MSSPSLVGPAQVHKNDLNSTVTVTHQVHISKSFVNSLQEATENKTKQPLPLYQLDEPSAWLDAHSNGKLDSKPLYSLGSANYFLYSIKSANASAAKYLPSTMSSLILYLTGVRINLTGTALEADSLDRNSMNKNVTRSLPVLLTMAIQNIKKIGMR